MSRSIPFARLPASPTMRFFISCLSPFRGWLLGLFFVTLCLAFNSSLKPWAMRELLNYLVSKDFQNSDSFIGVGFLFMLVYLFPVLIYRVHNYIWIHFAPGIRSRISVLSMDHLLYHHPYNFFQNHSAAELGNAIKEVTHAIPDQIKIIFDGFLCALFTILTAVLTVSLISWKFSVGLLLWIAFYIISSIIILKQAKKIGRLGIKQRSRILAKILEVIENIKCIRLLTREDFEREKLRHLFDTSLFMEQCKERCTVKAFALQGGSFIIYQGLCLFWLFNDFKLSKVTIGDFALVLTLNLMLLDYLRKIVLDFVDFSEMFGKIQQGLNKIASPSFEEIQAHTGAPHNITGEIFFDRVFFNYDDKPPLFKNKSLHIKMGEKIGIVGHSGSGKSTFLNILLQLYNVSSGSITIGGHNIENLSKRILRNSISVVPQAPSLFRGTIMQNIRYGRLNATDLEVIEAAKKACADEFIQQLPKGYHTLIDAWGLTLSAGQRQRIAVARAFLKNAPFLIFDEAMTHLDSITESQIQDALLNLIEEKTVLFVTHKPTSLLLHANRILVFHSGSIVEHGTHLELVAKQGLYSQLWDDVHKFVSLTPSRKDESFS